MKRWIGISVGLVVAAAAVSACGSSAGSTSCSDYRAKRTGDRIEVVRQMMSERKLDTQASAVVTTELSVDAYCFTHSSDAEIDGIYSG